MKFMVLARHQIEKQIITEKHIVISIRDRDKDRASMPKSKARLSVLDLAFDDVDCQVTEYVVLFNKSHAKQILKFFNEYKDKVDLIVCQCEAGISRSAGTAAALSKLRGQGDDIYFKRYIPNRHVYRTILEEGHKC